MRIATNCASAVIFWSCVLTIDSNSNTTRKRNDETHRSASVLYWILKRRAIQPIASGQKASATKGRLMSRNKRA